MDRVGKITGKAYLRVGERPDEVSDEQIDDFLAAMLGESCDGGADHEESSRSADGERSESASTEVWESIQ